MKRQNNWLLTELTILIFLIIFIPNKQNAQTDNNNVILGEIVTLDSEVLNEQRRIFVYTPFGYDRTKAAYPVIYVMDGGANFIFSAAVTNFLSRNLRMPRCIVVGVTNTDRTRDFTPVHTEDSQTSGGADNFLKFIENELMPYIENNYRTQQYKILFGHSLCGMFAVYTLFEKPEMFNAFIAVSPYLQYADQYVIDRVESILSERTDFKNHLFITLGDEPEYTAGLKRLEVLLSDKAENLSWEISIRESDNHGSIPLKSLYDGLEFIYSDWQLTDDVIANGVTAVKEHYNSLSEKYGYKIIPAEMFINVIGYRFLQSDKNEKAIEIFKYNIELYPKSANVYDSLGEAYEKIDEIEDAINNYKTAVKFGSINSDRNLSIYKQNLERAMATK